MASDIQASITSVRNEFGHVRVDWTVVDPHTFDATTALQLNVVELWVDTSPAMGARTKIAEARAAAVHASVVEGQTYYYQIRPRDFSGGLGDFYPATGGVPCKVEYATSAAQDLRNCFLQVSATGGALTGSLKTLAGTDPDPLNPVVASFRSATVSDGSRVYRQQTTPLSFTIPNGATMGLTSLDRANIWWVVIDNIDAMIMGAIVCSNLQGVISLPEDVLWDALTPAANAVKTLYAGAAISQKAIRVLGYSEFPSGITTAGTWTAPEIVATMREGMKRPGDVVNTRWNVQRLPVQAPSSVANMPGDYTIPQSNEGYEFFTTPYRASSKLNLIEHDGIFFGSIFNAYQVSALYEDSATDAIAAQMALQGGGPGEAQMRLTHIHRPTSLNEITYRVRLGDAATINPGTYNYTLNADRASGGSAGALLGGVISSWHKIIEYRG